MNFSSAVILTYTSEPAGLNQLSPLSLDLMRLFPSDGRGARPSFICLLTDPIRLLHALKLKLCVTTTVCCPGATGSISLLRGSY